MKPFPFLAALLLALLLVPLASAATVRPEQDMTTYTMDPVAANNTDLIKVECLTTHQIEVQISGTWSATISFQASNDDTNYSAMQAFPVGGGATVTSTTSTGQWVIPVTARWIRVRVTAYTSGTTAGIAVARDRPSDIPTSQITLAANQSTNIAQVAGGTAATNNGTASANTLRVAVASDNTAFTVNLGTSSSSALSLGKTEDSVHASGDIGVFHLGIRNDSLTQNAANLDYNALVTDRFGSQLMRSFEKTSRSFQATSNVTAIATTPTDVWDMFGNVTTTVVITRINITGIQTTAGTPEILIIKRSTANSAGTRVAATAVPLDASDSAASSAPGHYTANPTPGTAIGTIRRQYVALASAAAPIANNGVEWNFGDKGKGITLSGTAQGVALNLAGVTLTGGALTVEVDWYEF